MTSMPSPEAPAATPPRSIAILAVLHLAGFAITMAVFYPGIMTFDAKYVYLDMKEGRAGDWQSPLMGWLWSLIDPLAPGPASLFVATALIYWLAFALLAFAIARRSRAAACALPLLALSPPAFVLLGVIWRDVLFAALWLCAAALAFIAAGRNGPKRWLLQSIAAILLALGFLLRPNALPAAPLLLAYVIWPCRFSITRAALLFVPTAAILFGLIQVTYYGWLGATRQNPLHSIMVYDLGGITHFAKKNQFPLAWKPEQEALLLERCYQPTLWDVYWTWTPCNFVMQRLEAEKIFGSPQLTDAWRKAVLAHPLAYLQHRSAFMLNFLTGHNLTLWTRDIENPQQDVFTDRPIFTAFRALHDALFPTPLFRAGTWLLACLLLLAATWRKRETPYGAFVFGVCSSAIAYVASYYPLGVASDYRYAYWAVIAALAALPLAVLARRDQAR